jgi:hypothetical protein
MGSGTISEGISCKREITYEYREPVRYFLETLKRFDHSRM